MIYERTKMMNNQNQGKKIPVAQVPDTTKSHQVDKKLNQVLLHLLEIAKLSLFKV